MVSHSWIVECLDMVGVSEQFNDDDDDDDELFLWYG